MNDHLWCWIGLVAGNFLFSDLCTAVTWSAIQGSVVLAVFIFRFLIQ